MWRIELTRLARQGVACGHVHVVIVLAVVRQVIAIRVSIGSGLIWINRGWFCKNRDESQVVVSGGCVRCECPCCGGGRFLPYRRRLRLDLIGISRWWLHTDDYGVSSAPTSILVWINLG